MLTKLKNSKYEKLIIGTLGFFAYFILMFSERKPLELFHINMNTMDTTLKIIYMIIYEVFTIGIICFIFKDKLKKDWQDLKKNHKTYYGKCLKYWFISLGVMMFSNLIINAFSTNGIAENQKSIETIFKISPFYMFFSAVIYAPIVEELTFRQALRNIFKTDTLFILVSGLIFGGLHVITSYASPIDLLYIIPYSAPGMAFAYMLTKYDNIFVSMGFHFMHNGILMAIQFLLLLIG